MTFLALHNYLGLTTELFNAVSFNSSDRGPKREKDKSSVAETCWSPCLFLVSGRVVSVGLELRELLLECDLRTL